MHFIARFSPRFYVQTRDKAALVGSEDFKLQYGAYRWHWKVAGISEHENGGSYDGL